MIRMLLLLLLTLYFIKLLCFSETNNGLQHAITENSDDHYMYINFGI